MGISESLLCWQSCFGRLFSRTPIRGRLRASNPNDYTYAKLFSQIFDSSIADNWKHRHVFEDLLKLADQDGVVDMTLTAICARTRLPISMVTEAIEALCKPDPASRTKEEQGRRLIPIDPERGWGWKIVNYVKYREIRTEFDRRAYMREYMRTHRKPRRQKTAVKQGVKPEFNKSLTPANTLLTPAYASVCVSVDQGGGTGEGNELAIVAKMMALVGALMGRKPDQRWAYEDQARVAEICRRQDCFAEFKEIETFHKRMSERRYFPQSVTSLLEKWDSTLDRARRPRDKTPQESADIARMVPGIPKHLYEHQD